MAAQAGMSLVSAVFLLVVVTMIAGYAVSIGSAQQADTTLALLGRRADFAARSGLDWAMSKTLDDGACPANGSFTPQGNGLGDFTIDVICSATTVTEGSTSYPVFTISVTATRGNEGDEEYVRRAVSGQVSGV
jgi:MSHA biogenesis protein MshP